MSTLKQPLTFEEQVEHLENAHGLVIEDANTAIKILKHVNYYRLSAYGIGLKKQAPFLYKENVKYRNQRANKLFPVMLVIKRMTRERTGLWNHFMSEFKVLMDDYSDVVRLSFIGFPPNWYDILK